MSRYLWLIVKIWSILLIIAVSLLFFLPQIYVNLLSFGYPLLYLDTDENMTSFAKNITLRGSNMYQADIFSEWIHTNIEYVIHTDYYSATETYYGKKGVCRDNSLLLMSFLNTLGYDSVLYPLPNKQHVILKVSDNKGYFYCDPTQGSPYTFPCEHELDCPINSYCDTELKACIYEASGKYCWRSIEDPIDTKDLPSLIFIILN